MTTHQPEVPVCEGGVVGSARAKVDQRELSRVKRKEKEQKG